MVMMGVILAGGYSTRTRELGVEQKAIAKVRHPFTDEIDYMVNHQIEWMKQLFPEQYIVVLVGHKGNDVIKAIRERYQDVKIIWDRYIAGVGMAWMQVLERYGNIDFLSLNVDNLHGIDVVGKLKYYVKERKPCMVIVHKKYWKHGKGDTVTFDRSGIFTGFGNSNYMMSGIYVVNGIYVQGLMPSYRVVMRQAEFTPRDVYSQFLNMQYKVEVVKTKQWHDAGNVEGLKKVLVRGDKDESIGVGR